MLVRHTIKSNNDLAIQLQQMTNLKIQTKNKKIMLDIASALDEDGLMTLADFFNNHTDILLSDVILRISSQLLKSDAISQFIKSINQLPLIRLTLGFSAGEMQENESDLSQKLIDTIASHASFPVYIKQISSENIVTEKTLPADQLRIFQNTIITNIQTRYRQKNEIESHDEVSQPPSINHPYRNKKIRLKELIKRQQLSDQDSTQYLPVEVQHVHVIEQQIAVQEEEQIQLTTELTQIQRYSGQLIDWEAFNGSEFKNIVTDVVGEAAQVDSLYQLIKRECFANLPHAIKFLTPDAATHLASNLPAFVSLNLDNLPSGFYLRKTKDEEYVLDFDNFNEEKPKNAFAPVGRKVWEDNRPLYQISLSLDEIKSWVMDDGWISYFLSAGIPSQLTNIWIKFGAEGVKRFFAELQRVNCDWNHFLFNEYIVQLPQWEHFFDDEVFYRSIETINLYSIEKRSWLQFFMKPAGLSRNSLEDIVAAFEEFWREFYALCQEHRLTPPDAATTGLCWFQPVGGSPAVYMERLLSILKNARNFTDQLSDLDEIDLSNYGAYYASKYERLRAVSRHLKLHYQPDVVAEKQRKFSSTFNLYYVHIHQVVHIKNKEVYLRNTDVAVLRYIAAQSVGITLKEFIEDFYTHYQPDALFSSQKLLFLVIATLFTSHDRHQASSDARELLNQVNYLNQKIDSTIILLLDLYERNIRFTLSEGMVLLQAITGMNSSEFEGTGFEKDEIINKIKYYCDTNKYALYKLLQRRIDNSYSFRWPLKYAFDTADFFAHNDTAITDYFHDQLLTLSELLNAGGQTLFITTQDSTSTTIEPSQQSSENAVPSLYAEQKIERKKKVARLCRNAKALIPTMTEIKHYLHQAATLPQPNNLQFAIDSLIESAKSISFHSFLELCKQLAAIPAFDAQQVQAIISPYIHQTKSIRLPNMSTYDDHSVKNLLARMIVKLSTLENKPASIDPLLKEKADFEISHRMLNSLHSRYVTNDLKEEFSKSAQAKVKEYENNPFMDPREIYAKEYHRQLMEYLESLAQTNAILRAELDEFHNHSKKESDEITLHHELMLLSLPELQSRLIEAWQRSGSLLSVSDQAFLTLSLRALRDTAIRRSFRDPKSGSLAEKLMLDIMRIEALNDFNTFDKLNFITHQVDILAYRINVFLDSCIDGNDLSKYESLFATIHVATMDYDNLYLLFSFLNLIPNAYRLEILNICSRHQSIMADTANFSRFIRLASSLMDENISSSYIVAFCHWYVINTSPQEADLFAKLIRDTHATNPTDPVLSWAMHSPFKKLVCAALQIGSTISAHRTQLAAFYGHFTKSDNLASVLRALASLEPLRSQMTMSILALSHSVDIATAVSSPLGEIAYGDIARSLTRLDLTTLTSIHTHFLHAPMSARSLQAALAAVLKTSDSERILAALEKAPFGERDYEAQFSIKEVERVINQSIDMINQTPHTYTRRKQWLEAFMFVNDIGRNLPVYGNKPACQLSNNEIRSHYARLKANNPSLPLMMRQLLTIGLLREAMYRTTGEFAYSTQILAVINSLLHGAHHITNFDTGQGKSLLDLMRAALLYIDAERVDLTTSSIVDAKRDIDKYGVFFRLLGIHYSQSPITSASSPDDFLPRGINISTPAQLSLFYAKLRVTGKEELLNADKVSCIINESDFILLDDQVIYRFSTQHYRGISPGQEWIYYAINEFVSQKDFIHDSKNSIMDDIYALKQYLRIKAKNLRKSERIADKFSDDQYLIWIESSIIVNYFLRENVHYVIPNHSELKSQNGIRYRTKVAKVLMRDGKVSPDSTFGNGIQQLLYAKLNAASATSDFLIEPETKTIVSANNLNFINHYRAKQGLIWGSSGTVGSFEEIKELHQLYGFEFSKIPPHQLNRVSVHKPQFASNEEAQFKLLAERLFPSLQSTSTKNPATFAKTMINSVIGLFSNQHHPLSPHLVFFKDIETAERFYRYMLLQPLQNAEIQLYTGLGSEEEVIKRASLPRMITITTPALGRNTDISYNRDIGLTIWHTYIDSTRGTGQKNGRTGRQGSAGCIYTIVTHPHNSLSVSRVTEILDRHGKLEREFNNHFYSALGLLYQHFCDMPAQSFVTGKTNFLIEHWSDLSAAFERQYREQNNTGEYSHELFMHELFEAYQKLINAHTVKAPTLSWNTFIHAAASLRELRKPYHAYSQPVSFDDCTPSSVIAFHSLGWRMNQMSDQSMAPVIYEKLSAIFNRLDKHNAATLCEEYFHFLCQHSCDPATLLDVHERFLRDRIMHPNHAKLLFKALLSGGFDIISSDSYSNHLYMLRALSYADHSLNTKSAHDFVLVRDFIVQLLMHVINHSWFMGDQTRAIINSIILEIKEVADDISKMAQIMQMYRVKFANDQSTISGWYGNQLNLALDRALLIMHIITGYSDLSWLISNLNPLIPDLEDHATLDEVKEAMLTGDHDPQKIGGLYNALEILNARDSNKPLEKFGLFTSVKPELEALQPQTTQFIIR